MSRRITPRTWSLMTALLAAIAATWVVAAARAEDKAKSDDSSEKIAVEKVGDLAEEAPANETAAQAVQRITQKYIRMPVGGAGDDEYEKAKAAFAAKFPNDPLRWQLKMLDAQRALMGGRNRNDSFKAAQTVLAEIIAAKDAPQNVRESASALNLQLAFASGASKEDLVKEVSEHFKQFPDASVNPAIGQMFMRSITNGMDEEKAMAAVKEYKESNIPALAAAAEAKITELETLIGLKKNPIELKFTAVDGRDVDFGSLRGKVVLIDFWATWCGPCVAGMPEVIEQYNKYHDQGFEVVGISFDQDKSALEKFVKDHEMPWAQYFDGKGWENQYGKKYGIHAIPTMWLVGRDGHVVDFVARADLPKKIEFLVTEASGSNTAAK
jgi:thiol-disulfide isomerase/thioredoxin